MRPILSARHARPEIAALFVPATTPAPERPKSCEISQSKPSRRLKDTPRPVPHMRNMADAFDARGMTLNAPKQNGVVYYQRGPKRGCVKELPPPVDPRGPRLADPHPEPRPMRRARAEPETPAMKLARDQYRLMVLMRGPTGLVDVPEPGESAHVDPMKLTARHMLLLRALVPTLDCPRAKAAVRYTMERGPKVACARFPDQSQVIREAVAYARKKG